MFLEAIKTIVTMLNMRTHKNGIYTQRDTHARTHWLSTFFFLGIAQVAETIQLNMYVW